MATENYSKPELIVVVPTDLGLRVSRTDGASSEGTDISALQSLLQRENATLRPLFGETEERVLADVSQLPDTELQRMVGFYHLDAPSERLEDLADQIRQLDFIETAYIKPAAELASISELEEIEEAALNINNMTPAPEDAPPTTPDFVARQVYLNAAPEGIDANYAWTLAGGRGANVNVIDLEWGWRFGHEDLATNSGGLLLGTNSSVLNSENHGTAVIGVIGGDRNTIGITGISPDAQVSTIAFSMPTATAIRAAADRLRPGDIILLEIHRAGPRLNFEGRDDQRGYVAIEWWPDDYEAIRYAVSKGIIVVSAAGNGREDLDSAIYDTNPSSPFGPFPSWWRNPFRRNPLDAGSILVGAGAPPPGTHGRNHGPDRSRLDFSNFGSAVDAQGWGREVTTTGYGDLQGGDNRNLWYTDTFSGTSSASPIVVGALACTQGILRSQGRIPLSPTRARDVLHATGSPQQDAPDRPATQRIGNRPNLRQMIPWALNINTWTQVQFSGTLAARQTRRWFTYNWPAHWHVVWYVVPTTPRSGAPQIDWTVQVERASDRYITYWISIRNLTDLPVAVEARYAVLGW